MGQFEPDAGFPAARAAKVRLLVLDVDGVLTDGGLYFDESGLAIKRFDVQDGLGIKIAQDCGMVVAIITGMDSPPVARRMEMLGIVDYHCGFIKKLDALDSIRQKYNLTWEEVAFLGDDWVDLAPLRHVGLPMAVANAQPEVKALSLYVTRNEGGRGAVREVIRNFLISRGVFSDVLAAWAGE